jgi:hypothetical protein
LPELIPQPHGGALLSGGTPGQKGGPGAPPSVLRSRLQGSLAERIKLLEAIADDPTTPPRDRIRAIDVLARYGLGVAAGELTTEDIRERLSKTLDVIRHELSPDEAEHLMRRIEPIWRS